MTTYHIAGSGLKEGKLVPCGAKKSCTLKSQHYTEEQYKVEKAKELLKNQVASAERQNAVSNYLTLKLVQDLIEGEPITANSNWGMKSLVADDEDVRQTIQELINSGDIEAMDELLTERVNNEEFKALLELRDANYLTLNEAKQQHKILNDFALKTEGFDYDIVRAKGYEALEINEELQVVNNQIATYKNTNATLAHGLSEAIVERQKADGTYIEYTENTLNDLVETATHPSGSREWLEERQLGVGGSDIGAIIKADPKYGSSDYQRALQSKLGIISDEQVAEQTLGQEEFNTASSRGNAWEPYILNRFAENNPDITTANCKTSWAHKDEPERKANFDGLMLDKNGNPDGIVEIKTAANANSWGKPEDGLDAVPVNYRAQVLHYASAAGFSRGAVAVVIDDHEYREYHFKMTPELKAEAESNMEKAREFLAEVKEKKESNWQPQSRKGFPKVMIEAAAKGDLRAFEEASIYREESPRKCANRFNKLNTELNDPHEAMRKLFIEHKPEKNKLNTVSIDIETSTTNPILGHIIESGVSVMNPKGEEIDRISQLYGLPAKAREVGTGSQDVHGITLSQISKRRKFIHPDEQKRLLDIMKTGPVLAHNGLRFERAWFRQHISGYFEAEKRGEIRMLDSAKLTQWLVPSRTNKLSDFTSKNGIVYENAHRAHSDALMTAKALHNLRQRTD